MKRFSLIIFQLILVITKVIGLQIVDTPLDLQGRLEESDLIDYETLFDNIGLEKQLIENQLQNKNKLLKHLFFC